MHDYLLVCFFLQVFAMLNLVHGHRVLVALIHTHMSVWARLWHLLSVWIIVYLNFSMLILFRLEYDPWICNRYVSIRIIHIYKFKDKIMLFFLSRCLWLRKWKCFYFCFLGAASTARALSAYFDSLINFSMQNYFTKHFPLHSETFAPYADLFAMTLCLVITSKLNNQ